MGDDFYCTIKFKNGEEIFAKVASSEEEDKTFLLVSNPIVVEEIKFRGSVGGYKFEPWLKTTTEDMFIINIDDVLTMSESSDLEMIMNYEKYVKKLHGINYTKPSKKMGYISSVTEAKDTLEKIYNNS